MDQKFTDFNKKLVLEKKYELTFDEYFYLACYSKIFPNTIQLENLEKHKTFLFVESLLNQPAIHADLAEEFFPPLFKPINEYSRVLSKHPDLKSGSILYYNNEMYYAIGTLRIVLLLKKLYEYDKYVSHIAACVYYYNNYQVLKLDTQFDIEAEYDQLYDIYLDKIKKLQELDKQLEELISKKKAKDLEKERNMSDQLQSQLCSSGWDDGIQIIPLSDPMLNFVRSQIGFQDVIH